MLWIGVAGMTVAIQAVTKAPIKYVIYSHGHFDHAAGGQPFKELGAVFVAIAMRVTASPRSSRRTLSFPTRRSTASATSPLAAPRSS